MDEGLQGVKFRLFFHVTTEQVFPAAVERHVLKFTTTTKINPAPL